MSSNENSFDDGGQDILKKCGLFKKKAVVEGDQGCPRFQFSALCQYRTMTTVVE